MRRPAEFNFAFVRTDHWDHADADSRGIIEDGARRLGAAERDMPAALVGLIEEQPVVQAFEGARSLAWELREHRDHVSEGLLKILDWGASIDSADYDSVVARADVARSPAVVDQLFGSADVLVTPAVVGEAPAGLDSTGDPRFCRLWTLLGFPAITVPGMTGATGLPIGVQLVARPNADHGLLAPASHLAAFRLGDRIPALENRARRLSGDD